MISDAAAEGPDFFAGATGDVDGSELGEEEDVDEAAEPQEGVEVAEPTVADDNSVENESESGAVAGEPPEGGEGATNKGGHGGVAEAVPDKVAPKVSLGRCNESAQTVPSLLKTLRVCRELFITKQAAHHHGARQTKAAKEEAKRSTAAGSGVSETFDKLEEALGEVESVCSGGQNVIDRTLQAVDDAVCVLKPVSCDGRFILLFCLA